MNRRLFGLIALLMALGALRWIDPLQEKVPEVVAEVSRAPGNLPLSAVAATGGDSIGEAETRRSAFITSTGNAFQPRVVGQVSAPVFPPAHQAIRNHPSTNIFAVNADELPPVQEAPPPPPPLQVIGTWDDGNSPAVFLAGPQGTLLARPGEVILNDYKVQKITGTELLLKQISTQRDWPLSIPTVAETAPMHLKK